MPYDSGKLRNSGGDPRVGIAQWVGRKLKNHNPFAELVQRQPKHLALRAQQTNTKDGIVMLKPAEEGFEFPSVVYRLADGRRFEFAIREIPEDEDVGHLQEIGA